MRILFFGDSIAQGFYDRNGGWVQRLAHEYHGQALSGMLADPKFDGKEIFNLGVSGDTAESLLARLENEAKVRRWRDDSLAIVISIGVNDSRLQDNRALVDVYEFQKSLEKLLDKAQKVSDFVICVGLPAVDESKTNPWPYSSTGAQWSNPRINSFEDTLKQTAHRLGLPFVPIHDRFLGQLESGAELLADGLHPNEAGHQLIAELVKPALDLL